MKNLLSTQSIRHLELLEYLIKHNGATLAEVSEATNYASRTLWQDTKEINNYIDPIHIEPSKSGIQLIIPTAYSVRHIYRQILSQSKEYDLIEYLFYHEDESLEELADNLFISLSTLRRMIAHMNKKLEKFSFKIAVSPTRLIGDELRISQFYISFFSEKYYDLSDLLSPEEFKTLNLLLKYIVRESKWDLSFPDLQKLRIWGYVRLIRMQHNHPILYDKKKELFESYRFLNDKAFLQQFYATFKMTLDKDLLIQTFQVVFGNEFMPSYDQLIEATKVQATAKERLNRIHAYLYAIADKFCISLEGTEKMQLDLFNILQMSRYRHTIIYSRSRQFLEGFARDNQDILDIFYKEMKKHKNVTLEAEDFIYDDLIFTMLTEWPGGIDKLESFIPEIKLGLLFDTDQDHLNFIRKILTKYSKQKLSVIIPDLFSTISGQLSKKDMDILITDIPNLSAPGIEVICVCEYPIEEDWKNILTAQERIVSQKIKDFQMTTNKS